MNTNDSRKREPARRNCRKLLDTDRLQEALKKAAREAVLDHVRTGDPIVVWRDQKLVIEDANVALEERRSPKSTTRQIKELTKIWCDLVADFGRLFYNVAGQPKTIDVTPSQITQQRYYLSGETRKLFVSTSPESLA